MDQFYLSMAIIAGVAIVLALVSDGLKGRIPLLSTPMVATAAGILAGPEVLNLMRLDEWGRPHNFLLEAARLSVAMAVMGIALRVPQEFWRGHAGGMALVLTAGMFAMWAASALLCWWLLPVGFTMALLIGAVITPTDPVIAGSITTGTAAHKLVPFRVRHALAAEAGANDGAAYAFVTLPLMALLEHGQSSWSAYLTDGLLWGILLACAAGAVVGVIVGMLQRAANGADLPTEASLPSVSIALALLTLGALKLIGSDGILGVFVAGVAFNAVVARASEKERQIEQRQERTQELVNHVMSWPAFIIFGTLLPWQKWAEHFGPLIALGAAIVLLRRPPWYFFLTRPLAMGRGRADRLFLSWFGPIGMAAVFYSLHAYEKGHPEVWVYASFVVIASILIHGASATSATWWYGRYAGRQEHHREDPRDEDP